MHIVALIKNRQCLILLICVCVCLVEGIIYCFLQHPIYHSFVPADIQQLGAESDGTKEGDERSTSVWELRQRENKSKKKIEERMDG